MRTRFRLLAAVLVIFTYSLVGQQTETFAAQSVSSPQASPAAAGGGVLVIQRYVCNAEDDSRIDVFEPGKEPVLDDLDALECVATPGLFHLVSDSGRTVRSEMTEDDGSLTITGLAATGGPEDVRLVESESTGNAYIRIAEGETTHVVSYEYEFVFVMPTPPTIPEIDLDDDPPPPPSIEAGAGSGAADPDDDLFDEDLALNDSGDDSGAGDVSGFTDETGATKPVVDRDKRGRQVAFLVLALGAYIAFMVWKRRSRAGQARR